MKNINIAKTVKSDATFIVCTPFLLGEGVSLQPNFKKMRRGLTGSQFLKGGCWERGGDFFQGNCSFYINNKLKSEIFNKKSLETKMFFSVITKNPNCKILTKNLLLSKLGGGGKGGEGGSLAKMRGVVLLERGGRNDTSMHTVHFC